jgi:Bromodomain
MKFMSEKDVELGAFFSEPVDPVALGIPNYFQVVKEPMDLRTINRRMEAGDITTPEEFARLSRLVFENAMTFNIDPAHSVHQAARNLLVMFNQKFRDVERMVQTIRRTYGIDVEETSKKKGKDDKKRKRQDEQKSLKRIRLEEAQAMVTANASAVAAIVAAAPVPSTSAVTRSEFSMLLKMVQQLQQQLVQTHTCGTFAR